MRKRFKVNRIASSDNYEQSRRIHLADLQRVHASVELRQIIERIPKRKKYFVRVFGEELEITYEEYLRLERTVTIIIKEV